MSIARHHAEWLSLVEVSGPYLSLPVLMRVFPQGLDAHDPEVTRSLRLAFDEWEDNQGGLRPDPAIHRAWARFILSQVLELPDEVIAEGQSLPPGLEARIAEHGETLRPDFAVVNPEGTADARKPRLLVQIVPAGQDLDRPLKEHRWKASPATRMMELLHATGVRLGLVTNGERWMLVDAPRSETTGFASWYASLWLEERVTLQAFCSLLGVRRFFGVPDGETLEALLAESSQDQQEVTDRLGYQVRRAVEVLVQAIDRIDKDRGRALLTGVDEKGLYEAALTVMMRLVFLFSAEERGLLLLGDPLYDQQYAVSTLRAQLREAADQHGEEVLERRRDAWSRLLATFRAVYGGVQHERMRLPAYGGTLFDPDRFPFLEGRAPGTSWRDAPADPLPIHNRTVLHLLEALQMLQVKLPGGGPAEARRLSFRALDIEQIGHVYEGLLDHTAVRAPEPVLGLAGTKDREPEIPLAQLEAARARGENDLIAFLKEQTGRSESALRKALTNPTLLVDQRLLIACDNDPALYERVRPFAALLREDTAGCPVVIGAGSVYVTHGTDRRATGTHYTPRSLTEPIVQHTLDPLVYDGPTEGKPKEEWRLKPARALLDLKTCDLAMGSGAFLVQACRYLSERLVEAWEEAEAAASGRLVVTPEGDLATGAPDERPLPRDPEERLAIARRLVADRCLYGVDKNPMAVEMAKLSLWLITLQKNRPFTFLDHALKCGDSLLGVDMDQLRTWSLDRSGGKTLDLFVSGHIRKAIGLRNELAWLPERGIDDVQHKERLHHEAEAAMSRIKLAGDLIIAPLFGFDRAPDQQKERERLQNYYVALDTDETNRQLRAHADELLEGRRPFHWPLEFPEVFIDKERGGFDAIISNPPFMGGQKITGELGTRYRDYLVGCLANGQRGSADLCAYFFLRGRELLRHGGNFGMLATNTIAQGDTREVGLDQLLGDSCTIPRAVPSRKWPGTASLEVAHVWVRRGEWAGSFVLDDAAVAGITPFLTVPGSVEGKPHRLAANAGKSFQGSIVLGMGFVLTPEEAQALITRDGRNRDVLFPYLNGEDLNSRPDQSPSRWVINFHDWPLSREAEGSWEEGTEKQRIEWTRSGVVPLDYPEPTAEDYPDCLAIVREKVKPERDRNNRKVYRDRWWHYGEKRPELYATIVGMERVLVKSEVGNKLSFAFVPNCTVFSHMLIVFAFTGHGSQAVLQSTMHETWAREFSSSMRTDLRYTPSDSFETFPFPGSTTSGPSTQL
jgi:hypothetical protein